MSRPIAFDDVLAAAQKLKDAGIADAFVLPAGTKQEEAATMQGFYMALSIRRQSTAHKPHTAALPVGHQHQAQPEC